MEDGGLNAYGLLSALEPTFDEYGAKIPDQALFRDLQVLATVDAQDVRLECSDAGTPAVLKTVAARQMIVDIITKLFRCMEKTVTGTYRIIMSVVKDATNCMSKFPSGFFRCLAGLNVPSKISEIINAVLETINCVS